MCMLCHSYIVEQETVTLILCCLIFHVAFFIFLCSDLFKSNLCCRMTPQISRLKNSTKLIWIN